MSASDGEITDRCAQWRSGRRACGCRSSDRVDLRLVAVVVRDRSPALDQRRAPAAAGSSATSRTCRAGCRPTRRSAAVISVPSVQTMPRIASPSHVRWATLRVECAACRRLPRTPGAARPAPCRCRRPAGRRGRRGASRRSARRGRCRRAPARYPTPSARSTIAGPRRASAVKKPRMHVGGAPPAPAQQRRHARDRAGRAPSCRWSSSDGGSLAASSTIRTAGIAAFR